MMDFVLKMMNFVLQMMNFVSKMISFVLKMMEFVLKMMNFVLKMMEGGGGRVSTHILYVRSYSEKKRSKIGLNMAHIDIDRLTSNA